jgi:hypothetical protein
LGLHVNVCAFICWLVLDGHGLKNGHMFKQFHIIKLEIFCKTWILLPKSVLIHRNRSVCVRCMCSFIDCEGHGHTYTRTHRSVLWSFREGTLNRQNSCSSCLDIMEHCMFILHESCVATQGLKTGKSRD